MGLFDRMFGSGAAAATQQQPDAEHRFNELKGRYQTVLNAVQQHQVQVHNLHVQDNKLFLKGSAPSEEAKNAIWDQVKLVNANLDDITVEIDVNAGQAQAQGGQTYTVQSGDTLSKISKQFYGDAHEFMRIFYANSDKLKDPDKIQVGQELTIPSA